MGETKNAGASVSNGMSLSIATTYVNQNVQFFEKEEPRRTPGPEHINSNSTEATVLTLTRLNLIENGSLVTNLAPPPPATLDPETCWLIIHVLTNGFAALFL